MKQLRFDFERAALANYYAERLAMYADLPSDIAKWELFVSEVRAKYESPDTALEVLHAQRRLSQARGLTLVAADAPVDKR